MKDWVVQYVYATEKQENGISVIVIQAETYEEAKKIASEKAVAEEFIFTVHPRSDDQVLGQVRHDAHMKVGNGDSVETYQDTEGD